MNIRYFIIGFLISTNFALAIEVRKINPPKLGDSYLDKKILCHRPMRHGCPNMSIEFIDNKVVAHDYGHGGGGFTLGPGCANYVNNLLEQSEYSKDLSHDTPITVIGAGAIGLLTAYSLVNKGYKNITIIAEEFDDLTSHNAGGLLAPVSMDNDPKLAPIIESIGFDAYKFYESIAKKENSVFNDVALIVPTYFRTREESGLEPYVGKVMQPAKDVEIDFGTGKIQKMVVYDDGIFIDTAKMMSSLTNYLKPYVKFENRKIRSFSEINDRYIFNCTGLGSKELMNDHELVSIQGHLIMLKDQNPNDLQYMILVYLDEGKTKNNQKIKRSFYFFPKKLEGTGINDVGVIGGTFIENSNSSTSNEEEFEILLKNAKDFCGIQ